MQLRLLMGLWTLTLILFYVWWCNPAHIDNLGGFSFNLIVVSLPLIIPGYAFFFVQRMKKPNVKLGVPKEWRVAMIVTKAPSEPWSVVKRTLTGMLAETSVPHDTWLADEDPSPETYHWCAEHGVKISCRKGIPEYNNLDFPRRMKCKEGNLAYFLDHWGYRDYDFITQHDSDHMPLPGYLLNILVGFHDPEIGYVSAPSVCGYNAKDSWFARGRLWAESILHGTLQAGCYGNWAPMCIGSHFATRTVALKEIGGLGPELSEDHSTTFLFNAYGWKGVHAIDAVCDGRGPESFRDGVVQELQWCRSIIILFLTLTPKHIHKLCWQKKFQFLFSQLWYFLYILTITLTLLMAPVALIVGEPFMDINFWQFLIASMVPVAVTMGILVWLKHQKLLRPVDTRILNWEVGLYTIARYPIIVWAHIDAIKMTYFKNRRVWKVTPKKKEDGNSVPLRYWLPYAMIPAFLLAVQILFPSTDDSTDCFTYFNLLNIVIYGGLVVVIHALHKQEAKTYQEKLKLKN